MKLKYRTPQDNEAGAAVTGCGTIHISEIQATLKKLTEDLGFPFDLNNYTLGSTGKREYSGDIDLVIDDQWWLDGHLALKQKLDSLFGTECVKRNGGMVHLKYPIVGFDKTKNGSIPRTGFVQIDFNLGDVEWEKFYHYSPGENSCYKGAHRNLAIAAITYAVRRVNSVEIDSYGRPLKQIRWKWGPKGLIYVMKMSKIDVRSGIWMRKQGEQILKGPYRDPRDIARFIFPIDGVEGDLSSLESIMGAVKRNYSQDEQELIWKRMAENFNDWKDGKSFIYPVEIGKYFPANDK